MNKPDVPTECEVCHRPFTFVRAWVKYHRKEGNLNVCLSCDPPKTGDNAPLQGKVGI